MILAATIVLGSPVASAGAWELVQVGPNERSLEIRYGRGACETAAVHDQQSARTVAIIISYKHEHLTGNGVCPLILLVKIVKVPLTQPLAGRRVAGAQKGAPEDGPYGAEHDGTSHPVVPRLTGLAPADARFLLSGQKLHAAVRVVGKSTGLPRVVFQSPAAGARDPKNRVVRVNALD